MTSSHTSLTDLLGTQECDWADLLGYVEWKDEEGVSIRPSKGLGERLWAKGSLDGSSKERRAWLVACDLARAYNGMLEENGHTKALSAPNLRMKHLTECTELRPGWLPREVEGELAWSAQVPQGPNDRYPT